MVVPPIPCEYYLLTVLVYRIHVLDRLYDEQWDDDEMIIEPALS